MALALASEPIALASKVRALVSALSVKTLALTTPLTKAHHTTPILKSLHWLISLATDERTDRRTNGQVENMSPAVCRQAQNDQMYTQPAEPKLMQPQLCMFTS